MTTIKELKANGYHCKREERCGVTCYVVRDARGAPAIYGLSTYRSAAKAWAEALLLVPHLEGLHGPYAPRR